ncbi:MAG: restriction endonuclease-like protein [Chloroflexi bacterium]|nr:restriction endonuclease-like protein [Chloroflexota bacterium]
METLLAFDTDKLAFRWSGPAAPKRGLTGGGAEREGFGTAELRLLRPGASFVEGSLVRAGVPPQLAGDPASPLGPRLYEQTEYQLYAEAKPEGSTVTVEAWDPALVAGLVREKGGRVLHGGVDFGSQAGFATFRFLVDGQPEVEVTVEVFPTKLDYKSDYEQILAEVQETLIGLAFEYLRSTFRLGEAVHGDRQPTEAEWLRLLGSVAGQLETGLRYVARHPARALVRELQPVRAERIRRVDGAVRSSARKGAGAGGWIALPDGLRLRERPLSQAARLTLDTPEHRWLATQVTQIRRRLATLRVEEEARFASSRGEPGPGGEARHRETVRKLRELEERTARLGQLEPLAAAQGAPPPGFASLQLLTAPGYREAYQACMVLALGLRLEDGPVRLSLKELDQLYEIWALLAVLRLVSKLTGRPIPTRHLFALRRQGLHVLLERGRENSFGFDMAHGRRVTVRYNPTIGGDPVVLAQRPDLLVTLDEPAWPPLHLVLDAKYRLDASPDAVRLYGSPGPPTDAIDVLHRYRDAILAVLRQTPDALLPAGSGPGPAGPRPKHTVVQAAALFPYREEAPGAYRESRLWRSLDAIGIGAVPLLPGHEQYLEAWLESALRAGGWALADRAVDHAALERAHHWHEAAQQRVLLVGSVAHGRRPRRALRRPSGSVVPLRGLRWARFVVGYDPRSREGTEAAWLALRVRGSARRLRWRVAPVTAVRVEEAGGAAQWALPGGGGAAVCMGYSVGPFRRLDGNGPGRRGVRRRGPLAVRWTTRLALERARRLEELRLRSEAEWRLVEALEARAVRYGVQALHGGARFVTKDNGRVWYAGAAGFVIRHPDGREEVRARPEEVAELLASAP